MKTIIEKNEVDWMSVLKEVQELTKTGARRRVPLNSAYSLEKLKDRGVRVPEEVLDSILTIL